MKILQIIAQKPGQTGSGIFFENLIRVGAEKEHQQFVIAGIAADETSFGHNMPAGVLFCPVLFETESLPFPVPGMSDAMPYSSTLYRLMTPAMIRLWKTAFLNALRQAAEFQPDVIIVHHLWLLAALSREVFPDQPMIAICHGTELRQMTLAEQFRDEVITGCRQIERIAALHHFQKEAIAREYGIEMSRITVTGSGFNQDMFYPPVAPRDSSEIKILYAGKLSLAKGVPSLIRAFSRLDLPGKRIKLILAGAGCGDENAEIQQLAAASPFEIEFTGSLPQHRLAKLMRQCQIFILPSFYEGLSLVTLEALASGMHIVANDLPGMREWVGNGLAENGIVEYVALPRLDGANLPLAEDLPAYEQRLTEAISRQMAAVVRDPQIPVAGYMEMAGKYSWPALFAEIEKIYEQMRSDKKE